MIRRSFRIGLWLGLLAGIGFALAKILRPKPEPSALLDLGTPTGLVGSSAAAWPPLEAPVATPEPVQVPTPGVAPVVATQEPGLITIGDEPLQETEPEPVRATPAPPPPPPPPAPAPPPPPPAPAPPPPPPPPPAPPPPPPPPPPAPAPPPPPPPPAPAPPPPPPAPAPPPPPPAPAPPPPPPAAAPPAPAPPPAVKPDTPLAKRPTVTKAAPPKSAASADARTTKKMVVKKKTLAPWVDPEGRVCPHTHPVKGKLSSMIFQVPGNFAYERTTPDRCYQSADAAEEDGLRAAKR